MKVKSILFLSALLIISNFSLVNATYAEITAGYKFSNAPLVEPGIYDGVLGNNGTAYYKFNVLKGQTVNLSAVFTKAGVLKSDGSKCTCMVPAINGYDKNMFNLGSSIGKEYFHNLQTVDGMTKGPYCIRAEDTSPNNLAGYYKATQSGINYVAVSTGWAEVCPAYEGTVIANHLEADKSSIKTYYDLNITVEGIPDADAGTNPTGVVVATEPTRGGTIVSSSGQMSVCQFIDLLALLGVVDSAKAASVKATMACK